MRRLRAVGGEAGGVASTCPGGDRSRRRPPEFADGRFAERHPAVLDHVADDAPDRAERGVDEAGGHAH